MLEYLARYRAADAASFSRLSAMDTDPKTLLEEQKVETEFFSFGSLVDCLIFTPDEFNTRFYLSNVPKPGDKMGEWVDAFLEYQLPANFELQQVEHLVLAARKKVGYQLNWKDETVLSKFEEQAFPYLEVIANAGDLQIIDQQLYDKAYEKATVLQSNDYTSGYFATKAPNELWFQRPLYFEWENCACKALVDGIKINHQDKTVLVYDLKTTSKPLAEFENAVMSYRYYIQAAFYLEAVSRSLGALGLDGYKVLNEFHFVVADPSSYPHVWVMDAKHLSAALVGGVTRRGVKFKGVYQLLENYKWHRENGLYDYPATVYQNNGTRTIDLF